MKSRFCPAGTGLALSLLAAVWAALGPAPDVLVQVGLLTAAAAAAAALRLFGPGVLHGVQVAVAQVVGLALLVLLGLTGVSSSGPGGSSR